MAAQQILALQVEVQVFTFLLNLQDFTENHQNTIKTSYKL